MDPVSPALEIQTSWIPVLLHEWVKFYAKKVIQNGGVNLST